MRALPSILRKRPRAHVLIVGEGHHRYSQAPARHRTYAHQLIAEIDGAVDRSRIHFLGHLPSAQYRAVLRISAVHVYLTYPFILSWSLLEAMATGCLVIASRTPPVEEVVADGENGLLAGFFDRKELVDKICHALANRARLHAIRSAARSTVVKRYDLTTVCLPQHLRLYERLTGRATLRVR
jgi:glycosyltransferase involved in cell wall biosynthesis